MLWGTGIGQFFFSIRKQHTVYKGTRVQGTCSEYFQGDVFLTLLVYTALHIMVFGAVRCSQMKELVRCPWLSPLFASNVCYRTRSCWRLEPDAEVHK